MRRERGESIKAFAQRLYEKQVEVYSVNAWMGNLHVQPFSTLDPKIRKQWMKTAKKHGAKKKSRA